MLLTTLPQESLAQIASNLNSTERENLAASHPHIAHLFREENDPFWDDVYRYRFKKRLSGKVKSLSKTSSSLVRLHDIADDFLLYSNMVGVNVNEESPIKPNTPPIVATANEMLHIAHARSYRNVRLRRNGDLAWQKIAIDSDASAIGVEGAQVVLGLQNGLVCVGDGNSDTWRRMRGHVGRVHSVDICDGAIASAGADRTVRVRRAGHRGNGCVLRGHGSGVHWVHGIGDGQYATHAGSDGRVKLWDVTRGACLATTRFNDCIRAAIAGSRDVFYIASGPAVHVVDARAECATVCILSLPRIWQGFGNGFGALALRADGTLAATVGGGGVAVWDARGSWEARGLGSPKRWDGDDAKTLRAVHFHGHAVVAGGGAKEVLTFALDGSHDGFLHDSRARRGAISWIGAFGDSIAVARVGGRVDVLDIDSVCVDWEAVNTVAAEKSGLNAHGRFWFETTDCLNADAHDWLGSSDVLSLKRGYHRKPHYR